MTKQSDTDLAPVRAERQPVRARAQVSPALEAFLSKTFDQVEQSGADENALWAAVEAGEQMEIAGRLVAGRACFELLKLIGEQKVSAELRLRGMARRTFYELIDVYSTYNAIPSTEKIAALAAVGYTKSRSIATWDATDVLAFVGGKKVCGVTLDQAVEMTTREFTAAIADATVDQKLALENKRLQDAAEVAQMRTEALQRQLNDTHNHSGLPSWSAQARQEAVVQSARIALALDVLEKHWNEILTVNKGSLSQLEWERGQKAGAGTLYHLLIASQARIAVTLSDIKKHFGQEISGGLDPLFTLSASERERYLASAEDVLAGDRTDNADRAIELRAQGMKGKGRRPETSAKKSSRGARKS